jgi:hypothetical protein
MKIAQASATISDMQIQLSTYWSQTIAGTIVVATGTNHIHDPVDRIEKAIVKYIQHCTQHVKKLAETRIQSAKPQIEQFKTLEDFQQVATSDVIYKIMFLYFILTSFIVI